MAIISLGEFREDTIVVHFGGEFAGIDVYTFADSLIGFADTARAVSATIDPGQEIEIRVEATGPGSYRTVIRRWKKGYGGVLSHAAAAIFWGVVANVVYDNLIKNDPKPQIIINSDEVIYQIGTDTIIVPRSIYDSAQNAKKNPDVQDGLRRTFLPLQSNGNVTEFGLTTRLHDAVPLVRVPRDAFTSITEPAVITEDPQHERTRTETARLVILKAWLNHAKRKWSFEWNGIPISAPIIDRDFLDRIDRREYLIGAGDALDVTIVFKQTLDPILQVYINDPNSFVISKIIKPIPKG
jgi:hypothetical protein